MDDTDFTPRKNLLRLQLMEFSDSKVLPHQQQIQSNPNRSFRPTRQQFLRRKAFYGKLRDKSYIQPPKPVPRIERWLNQIDQRFQIIAPDSSFLLFWNLSVIIAILFEMFFIPISLFLTEQVYEDEIKTFAGIFFNILFLLILLVDMPIRFNISYYQKGKLITSRLSIFKKYVSLLFWIDLTGFLVVTIYLLSQTHAFIYLKLIFYLKIVSLVKIDRAVLHRLQMSRIVYCIYRLVRLIGLLLFITTWIATIFFAIDYHFYLAKGYYYQRNQLWLTNTSAVGNLQIIKVFSWYVWYQYALYWALQTSATVGYGDLTPMNPPQVLYCNFVILLMTVLFAFFINSIWEIIGEVQESSVEYSENWNSLKTFLRNSQISSNAKQKISSYLYEIWMDDDDDEIQQTINSMLSNELRDQFYFETKSKFFSNIPLFETMSHISSEIRPFLRSLIYLIKEENYSGEDIIYEEGNIDLNLYFVKKGQVKLSVEGSNLGEDVKVGGNFGIWQFFTERPRTHNATTISFCKIWKLFFIDFHHHLKKYRSLHQKYSQIMEKVRFSSGGTFLNIKCWKCQSPFHWFSHCESLQWGQKIFEPKLDSQSQLGAERVKVERMNRKSEKFRGDALNKGQVDVDCVFKMHFYLTEYNVE